MGIKQKIRNVYRRIRYGVKASSDIYINHLRSLGMTIGERCVIFDPMFTLIDETRPWMIEIGNDVQITRGVTILTHGYDWSVLKGKYGVVLGSALGVSIGNNVFIGMNTTILKGVHIGDNVIIGAGSLINKDIPNDCVVAGNPAKVVCGLEDYLEKRKAVQEEEAKELVWLYRKVYNREPGPKELSEFFLLWTDESDIKNIDAAYWDKINLVGNGAFTLERLKENRKKFSSIKSFLKETK